MRIEQAKELLLKFEYLVGTISPTFEKKVVSVFIGYKDSILTRLKYSAMMQGQGIPALPTDFGEYNICIAFEDGEIVAAKTLVEVDNLTDLSQDAEPLHYMTVL